MKKLLALTALLSLSIFGFAQKYACVDTEYILASIPEYEQAKKTIENFSIEWQKEIESKFQAVDKLYKAFQAEAHLLPDDLKVKRENEIIAAEKEAKELQKKRFGSDGDLAKKRSELMKPIQDKIYNVIEKRALDKGYAFVFDKADNANMLYVDPKYDISDDILDQLGYKSQDTKTKTKK